MNTLYSKLATVLLGLFCLIGILFLVVARFSMVNYQLEITQKLNSGLASHIVAETPLLRGGRVDDKIFHDVFDRTMAVNPATEVYLLDSQGGILAFSAPTGKVKRKTVALSPIIKLLRGNSEFPILGDDPRRETGTKIFSAAAIPAHGRAEGYLYIILGGEEYDSIVQVVQESYILRLGVSAILATLLFALLSGLVLFALLTQRLRRLTAVVEGFKQSDFADAAITLESAGHSDEIGRLGQAFQKMGQRIVQQMQRLQDTDKLRREMVANVSHDLRTPLTAMQGYVETLLLKRDTLTPEERGHYLETTLKHSEHLGKLVAELFELAKLDSNEIQLHRERFPIAELMQDVVQEFRLAAEKRQVKLEIQFQDNSSPLVFADISLLARVFGNLIENALRYTSPGGAIRLSLRADQDRACIQLSDTGCGITPEELPFIFERFYRLENSQGQRSEGAGLGLAIAKRILELHDSQITVESTPNVGTTFVFRLPVVAA